jgi:hypothetical protein
MRMSLMSKRVSKICVHTHQIGICTRSAHTLKKHNYTHTTTHIPSPTSTPTHEFTTSTATAAAVTATAATNPSWILTSILVMSDSAQDRISSMPERLSKLTSILEDFDF